MTGDRSRDAIVLLLVVVSIPLLAGCGTVPEDDETRIHYNGNMNVSDEGLKLDGNVSISGTPPDVEVFRNVSIGLYSERNELIYDEPIGDLEAENGRLAISLSVSTVPQYIIIDSPDFWREDVSVTYYCLDDRGELFLQYVATAENELFTCE